jgi:ketosteroid isomerase-like protein
LIYSSTGYFSFLVLKENLMKQNNYSRTALLLGLSFLFTNCNNSNTNTHSNLEEAKMAIAASNAIYFESFEKNDSSVFINRYAKDACIMAPNTRQVCGYEEVVNFFRTAYNDCGMRNGKFITTAVYGDAAEYVTEEGLWQSFNAKGELFDDGKFLVLWKKTPDGWKMFRDTFSSNHNPK